MLFVVKGVDWGNKRKKEEVEEDQCLRSNDIENKDGKRKKKLRLGFY